MKNSTARESHQCGIITVAVLIITFALKMPEGYVLIDVYLFICMSIIRKTQKVLNRIACNLVG